MKYLKQKAIQLRKQGKSYLQIQQILGVAKSTLSLWLRDIQLSDKLIQQIYKRGQKKSIEILVKRNKSQTQKALDKAKDIRNLFSKEIGILSRQDLFYLGMGLYLGEGYKRGADGAKWKCVDIANSDPEVIRIMMRFFRECCGVKESDFRIFLSLHTKTREEAVVAYWMKQTALKKENFMKTSFLQAISSHHKYPKRLEYGTVHIRVYNTDFFHQIIGWIDGIRNMV